MQTGSHSYSGSRVARNFPVMPRHLARLATLAKRRVYPLHQAADKLAPAFEVAVRAAFAAGRKKADDADAAADAVKASLEETIPSLLLRAAKAGGRVAVDRLTTAQLRTAAGATAKKKALAFTFDAKNPRMVKRLRVYSASLIKDISETTRDRVREALTDYALDTFDSRSEAFAKLADVVGDTARAQLIARTESMRAVHEGQREAWDQAVDEGLLTGEERRVWIVTPDDVLCPICEALDGETATLDGTYTEDVEAPPAHPNCRCTEGLQ